LFSQRFGNYRTTHDCLLYHLDTVVWALHLAGSADQALAGIDGPRFSLNNFKDANWASVLACAASIAIVVVNFHFRHGLSTPEIKQMRMVNKNFYLVM